jgi:FAD:protein FMN transferase
MDRRQFIQPRRLVHAAAEILGAADIVADTPAEARSENVALLRFAQPAMATGFEIIVPFGTAEAPAIAESGFAEIDRLEQQLTVYCEHSEVSRLNRCAAAAAVPVESGLFHLLSLAAQITNDTAGAYDIATGALTKAWGFFKGPRRVPDGEELRSALAHSGMAHVRLDPETLSVRFRRRGVEINLGSIAKGYALDRVAALLKSEWNLPAALMHGGHSSLYAIGSEPGSARGWTVGIRHPRHSACRMGVLRLCDRALGTSAATFQHLEYNGRKLGHILDPRTGWPAEGMAGVTVVAPSAALADALSTAFFIMGVEAARAYCEAHPEIGALLIPAEEQAMPVVVGLTPDDVTLYDS